MIDKIEITINVIVHATEDILKIFQSFEEVLELKEEEFTMNETLGHYENPIVILNAKIVKKQAQNFIRKLNKMLPTEQVSRLIEEIEERTVDSRFHVRIDKQELMNGNLRVKDNETIQIKVHTPIYNKKDTVKTFTEIFQTVN